MSKHDAIKALDIYKRAGQQVDKSNSFESFTFYSISKFLSKVIFLPFSLLNVGWKSSSFLWLLQRLGYSSNLSISHIETGLFLNPLDIAHLSWIKFFWTLLILLICSLLLHFWQRWRNTLEKHLKRAQCQIIGWWEHEKDLGFIDWAINILVSPLVKVFSDSESQT